MFSDSSFFCAIVFFVCAFSHAGDLVFSENDARTAYADVTAFVHTCTPRHAGTAGGRRAAEWICSTLVRRGINAELDCFSASTPDGVRPFANVVAAFRGESTNAPWIVVMSHFDTAPNVGKGFEGANDGASTSGLLIALATVLRQAGPSRENVALVWTDAEECRYSYSPNDGFQGSKHLVEMFRTQGRRVKAAICLDMLGDKDLKISIPVSGTPALRKVAMIAAARAGVADKVELRDDLVVTDDHTAFLEAGCSAIDLIDFDFGSVPGKNDYWHQPADTLDKISVESLSVSGRLVCALMNLCRTERK